MLCWVERERKEGRLAEGIIRLYSSCETEGGRRVSNSHEDRDVRTSGLERGPRPPCKLQHCVVLAIAAVAPTYHVTCVCMCVSV